MPVLAPDSLRAVRASVRRYAELYTRRPDADIQAFRAKAAEDLAGAESEYREGRHNTCAKLAYYGCFHAAMAALLADGVSLPSSRGVWSHAFVRKEFARRLIIQRKQYPSSLRDALSRTYDMRQIADYTTEGVTEIRALRALRRASDFVTSLQNELERGRRG